MISSITSGGGNSAALQSLHQGGRHAPNASQIADKLFAKMDTNSDGLVDKAELSTTLASMSTNEATMPTADDLFAKFDADGNGTLTKEESSEGLQSLMQEYGSQVRHLHRPDPDKLFAKFDTNGDGSLDKPELTAALEQRTRAGHDGPSADDLFGKLDADGDGKISKEEHRTALESRHNASPQSVGGNETSPFASFITGILQQYKTSGQDSSSAAAGSSFSVAA